MEISSEYESSIEEDEVKREKSCICRICHESGKREIFIAPCLCKGSLKLVHKNCLETWLARSYRAQCELCGFHFKTRRTPKYTMITSIFAWLSSPTSREDRRILISDVVSLMIMIPALSIFTMQAVRVANKSLLPEYHNKYKGEDVITWILQAMLLCCVLVCDLGIFAWTIMRIHFNVRAWSRWYRKSCVVILIDYENVSDNPTQSSIQTSVHQE